MPNNVNISDYEKIIFVNNINEENNNQKDLIVDNNYNFAIFFTNNSKIPNNWPKSLWGNQIRNIWYKGQRLNRFVGIHPNNNAIDIGNNTYKLYFNYEDGLLSIINVNQLTNIEFVSIIYRNAYTNTDTTITDVNNISVINSQDNTFKLTIKFDVKNIDGADASKLGPEINFDNILNSDNEYYFTWEYLSNEDNLSANKLSIERTYKIRIQYDTENEANPSKLFSLKSIYDDEHYEDIRMILRLNPTDLLIKRNNVNAQNNINYNNPVAALDNIPYTISFMPDLGKTNSYPLSNSNRKLYVRVKSRNTSIVCINRDNNEEEIIEISGNPQFNLFVKPNDNIRSTEVIVTALYLGTDNIRYEYPGNTLLSKTYTINVGNVPVLNIDDSLGNNTLRSTYNGSQIDTSWSSSSTNFRILSADNNKPITSCGRITYELYNVNNPKGSYTLSVNSSSIYKDHDVTIYVVFNGTTLNYSSQITAEKEGYTTANRTVTLTKSSTIPQSVTLSNGKTVNLTNGRGSVTYTATTNGTFTITTQDSTHTNGSITYTVSEQPPQVISVSSVLLSPATVNTQAQTSVSLTATVLPSNATNKSVTWSSSNTSVATVDNNGIVNCKTAGTAIITVRTVDGNKTATSTINVTAIPQTSYYWYAGAGPVNSSTIPGSDANWHLITGTPTRIETGELENSTKINWILAVPTALNLNQISNGVLDITTAYDITTVTCTDGVEYKIFTQISQSKKTDIIIS